MKTWIVTLLIMYSSWHFTDVRSESLFQSVLLPLLFIVLAIFLFVKMLTKLGLLHGGGSSNGSGFYGDGGDGGSCGGDGGGCD